ncbi:MAG: hypothetical protein M5T61_01365 [Acidimicrobiia bacterium]|nr:hypothetical protein [Acidimicrobiia bacterium]
MGPFDGALLSATVLLTTPLLLAAIGELYSERAGGLERGPGGDDPDGRLRRILGSVVDR